VCSGSFIVEDGRTALEKTFMDKTFSSISYSTDVQCGV